MATNPENGKRVAFEVQISGQTVEEGRYRTERYARDGIETYWVAAAKVWWLWKIPGFRIEPSKEDEQLWVTSGIATFTDHSSNSRLGVVTYACPTWLKAPKVSLDSTVESLLRGHLGVKEISEMNEIIPRGRRRYSFDERTVVALVSSESLERAAANDELERMEEEQRERDRAAREQWEIEVAEGREQRLRDEEKIQSKRRAFYERQERVLTAMVSQLQAELAEGEVVLVGTPPRNPELPAPGRVPILSYEGSAIWVEYPINGNNSTADGAAVWTKVGANEPMLRFVVCPDVRRVRPNTASNWRALNIRVFVETKDEAIDVAKALRWHINEILISGTAPSEGGAP